MNTRNDWKNFLKQANEELAKDGVSIDINDDDEEGFYSCEILKDGNVVETYAENYYENELDELVSDAFAYALDKFGKLK